MTFERPRLMAAALAFAVTIATLAVPISATAVTSDTLFVSPNGSGSACTSVSPCSLTAAQAAVRALNDTATGDVVVELAGGTYTLDAALEFGPEDGGRDSSHKVIWRGEQGAVPLLTGATSVTGWTQAGTVAGLAVWKASAPPGVEQARHLYVDGVRAVRARSDYVPPLTVRVAENVSTTITTPADGLDIADWRNLSDVELEFHSTFLNQRCPIEAASRSGGVDTIRLPEPCWDSIEYNGNFSQMARTVNMIENAYELLDSPGEWYFDQTGAVSSDGVPRFFYIPRTGQSLTGTGAAEVTVPRLQELLTISGTVAGQVIDRVANLNFEGITFADTTWELPKVAGVAGKFDDDPRATVLPGTASQSSTAYGGVASRAADGNTNGAFYSNSVTHTGLDVNAWWQLDLGASKDVSRIEVWNRTDLNPERLTDYWVFVSDTAFNMALPPSEQAQQPNVSAVHQTVQAGSPTSINLPSRGRYVMVQLTGTGYLSLAEVRVISGGVEYGGANGTAGSWTKEGSWHGSSMSTGQYRLTQHVTTQNGDWFRKTFNGTGISYISTRGSDRGTFSYSIDGGPAQMGTCTHTELVYQQPCLTVEGLAAGNHSITITKTGGTKLSLDAFEVTDPPNDYEFPAFINKQGNVLLGASGKMCDIEAHVPTPAAVTVAFASNIAFTSNEITRVGQTALLVKESSNNIVIRGNRITDASANGVHVGGGSMNDMRPAAFADRMHDIVVENNYVGRIGVEFPSAVGIMAGYVDTLTIRHNEIADVPYSGISVGWGWGFQDKNGYTYDNGTYCPSIAELDSLDTDTIARTTTVTDNYIHDFMRISADGGGVYTLGKQPGSLIARNYMARTGAWSGHQRGVYLDNGSNGFTVKDNVFDQVTSPMLLNYCNCGAASSYGNIDGGGNVTTKPWSAAAHAVVAGAGLEPSYRSLRDRPDTPNLARGASATATVENGSAPFAVDGNTQTRWQLPGSGTQGSITIEFETTTRMNRVELKESQYAWQARYGSVAAYVIEYKKADGTWATLVDDIYPRPVRQHTFTTVAAQAVRVTISRSSGGAGFDEIGVYNYENLALNMTATQSSTNNSASASRAVDGNTDGTFYNNSVTHTGSDPNAWWQVDLGKTYFVSDIEVFNRTNMLSERLSDYWVFVSENPLDMSLTPAQQAQAPGVVWHSHQTSQAGSPTSLAVGASGRYVAIRLNGTGYLSLAEVQAFGSQPGVPEPLPRTATQSSTLLGADASRAIDGITNGTWSGGSVTHTNQSAHAWWTVDLSQSIDISSIRVWNRADYAERLTDYWVFVSDSPFDTSLTPQQQSATPGVWSSHQPGQAGYPTDVAVNASGRYVMVQLNGTNYLSLAEVQIVP